MDFADLEEVQRTRFDGARGDLIVALRLVMPPAGDARLLAELRRLQG